MNMEEYCCRTFYAKSKICVQSRISLPILLCDYCQTAGRINQPTNQQTKNHWIVFPPLRCAFWPERLAVSIAAAGSQIFFVVVVRRLTAQMISATATAVPNHFNSISIQPSFIIPFTSRQSVNSFVRLLLLSSSNSSLLFFTQQPADLWWWWDELNGIGAPAAAAAIANSIHSFSLANGDNDDNQSEEDCFYYCGCEQTNSTHPNHHHPLPTQKKLFKIG